MDFLNGFSEQAVEPSFRRFLTDKSEVFMDVGGITNVPIFGTPLRRGFKVLTNPVPKEENDSNLKADIVQGMVVKGKDGIMRLLSPKV